ncbi:hypothetical protein PMIN01_10668 [Paraphaeosphaeria minitans]|uniref:Uncharacterized protein n=1 Tax=Paraphaeosphaeria minitans TaxID=565426 RepID=A0A9P6KMF4_9PLEO|nr:hypothetical protein PMIN01_10668 [Paraphaeosphaeria minitans]
MREVREQRGRRTVRAVGRDERKWWRGRPELVGKVLWSLLTSGVRSGREGIGRKEGALGRRDQHRATTLPISLPSHSPNLAVFIAARQQEQQQRRHCSERSSSSLGATAKRRAPAVMLFV